MAHQTSIAPLKEMAMMVNDDDGGSGTAIRPLTVQELLAQPDRNTYYVSPREIMLRKKRARWHANKEINHARQLHYRLTHKEQIKAYNFRYRLRIKEEHPLVHREHLLGWQDCLRRARARDKAERAAADAQRIASNRQLAVAASAHVKSAATLRQADFHRRIVECIPGGLPKDRRDDVISEITIAVLSGEIGLDEIEAKARLYVKRTFREIDYGHMSLDEAVGEGDGVLLRDAVSRGLWD